VRRGVLLALLALLLAAQAAQADQYGERLQALSDAHDSWFNFSSFSPTRFEAWSTACAPEYVERFGWQDSGNPVAPVIQSRQTKVPLPCFFGSSSGSDQEASLIWHGAKQPGQYDYCDFWGMAWDWPYAWHDRWGGCADDSEMIPGPGRIRAFPYGMGVQGSGIAFFPGTITVSDLARGRIDHAVQVEVPEACGTYAPPAQRTDGSGTLDSNPNCFPYGVLVKAPQSASCVDGTWFCRVLLQAAKDYGLMATDQTHDSIVLRFENYRRKYAPWGDSNPYAQYMSGADCDKSQWRGCGNRLNQMYGFPWASLYRP
jgi:hypothetical protein